MIPIGTSFELRQQAFSTSIVLEPEGVPAHVIFLVVLDIPRLVGVKRRLAGCGATRPWVRRSWCGGGGSRAGCRPAGWPAPAGPGGGSRRGRAAGRSRPGRRVSGKG